MTGSRAKAPPEQVARVLGEVMELLQAGWDREPELSPAPLSTSQLKAMFVLERAEGSTLTALADAMDITPSSMSRLCDRLQAAGFIDRAPSSASRRAIDLRLTDSGRKYLATLRTRRQEALCTRIADLPEAARVALLNGLMPLRSVLDRLGEVDDNSSRTA